MQFLDIVIINSTFRFSVLFIMKRTLQYFPRLRILLICIMTLVGGYSRSQTRSDTSLILKTGKFYEYQNGLYKKRELKHIIYRSHDSQAIGYYKKYRGYKIAGPSLIACGSLTVLYGLFYQLAEEWSSDWVFIFTLGTEDPQPSNTGNIIAGIGAGVVGLGIIFTVAAGPAFQKSINRFNSVRIGDQQVRVNILPGQESLSLRLVWQIDYSGRGSSNK